MEIEFTEKIKKYAYWQRLKVSEVVNGALREFFKSVIRTCVRVKEAPSFGKSIFDYAPHSRGAKEYTKLVTEVIGRVKK